jgi:hypothetical protein
MNKLEEPDLTEDVEADIAATLTPRDYLLVRLNATLQGRGTMPAAEGWRINTKANQ